MARVRWLALALVLVGCGSAPPVSPSSAAQDRELLRGLERRVFANGMGVVALEGHRLPTVTAMLA